MATKGRSFHVFFNFFLSTIIIRVLLNILSLGKVTYEANFIPNLPSKHVVLHSFPEIGQIPQVLLRHQMLGSEKDEKITRQFSLHYII